MKNILTNDMGDLLTETVSDIWNANPKSSGGQVISLILRAGLVLVRPPISLWHGNDAAVIPPRLVTKERTAHSQKCRRLDLEVATRSWQCAVASLAYATI